MNKPSRHIRLDASHTGTVRFLSGLSETLGNGGASTWVTITRTGKFTDPRYGEFEISRTLLSAMVSNFDKRVFGQDVFIDVAHKPNDGAAAKVIQLKIEGDRLRALCEWTTFGLEAIRNRGYRYLSIEYHEHYKDNENGTDFGPVMMGAALVVRPAIKHLDPIQLSEVTDQGIPVLIHPELQTKLLQELHIMHKKALELLKAKLAAKKLAAAVVTSLMAAAENAVALVTDEAAATTMLASFEEAGTQLAEQIGGQAITLSIDTGGAGAGLNQDQVIALMASENARAVTAAQAIATKRKTNVVLLSETIGAVATFDEPTKKLLAEAVEPLVTADMTADQVVALAQVQIKQGQDLAVARQLSALGYHAPLGSVRIPGFVIVGDEPKKLQGIYRDHLKLTEQGASGKLRLPEKDTAFISKVLAEFDRIHAPQISNEVKMLSGGQVGMADTNLPVGFRREVIREALSDLRVLELVQTLVDFQATVITQIPYEVRDVSQIVNDGVVYEGQAIPRAGISQAMDLAYILPMKLAMLITNEAIHFTQAAAINWDAMARNVESNARIMRELICRRILNELQRAADSYGSVAVVAESFTSQLTGAETQVKTVNFPLVRQFQQRDLQGNAIGNVVNPITVVLNSVACLPYDGSNKQAAGTYYRVNSYNLGYIQFVNQGGQAVTPANTGTNTIAYSRATNVSKVDLDVAEGLTFEQQMNKPLQAIGSRKAMLSSQRFVQPDFLLMSPVMNDNLTNAEQFAVSHKRSGTDTSGTGDLETVKGLPAYGTNAPGVDMGDERILIGQRGLLGYVVGKPFITGEPFEAVDGQGNPIGKKQAYGEEYSAIKVPAPVANRMTSVLAYSFSGR